MSDFYNPLIGGCDKVSVMKTFMSLKHHCLAITLITGLLVVSPIRGDDPPAPTKTPVTSPLEAMAFLVGGEWEAKLPAQPGGQQISILAHFTWANNHQVIRISNVFSAGGKPVPYIDGIYAWQPQKRVIVFWYVDSKGGLYEGTVKPESGALVHEFKLTDAKGEVSEFTARQTMDGTNAWVNEIFSRKDGNLEPEVKVRYEKVK
jgi:hypothetical protein